MDFLNWRHTGESAHPAFFGDFSGISTRKRPYGHRRADSHVVGKQELTGEPQGD